MRRQKTRKELEQEFLNSMSKKLQITGATSRAPLIDFKLAQKNNPQLKPGNQVIHDKTKKVGQIVQVFITMADVRWENGEVTMEYFSDLSK